MFGGGGEVHSREQALGLYTSGMNGFVQCNCGSPWFQLSKHFLFFIKKFLDQTLYVLQVCIPAGCVPSAVVAVSGVGGVCPEGCLPKGEAVCPEGCLAQGGVGIPACTEADTLHGQNS